MSTTTCIVIMAVCLMLSAYFSATETAFSSANTTRLKTLAEKGNKRAALVCRLLERYDRLLSTILIGNNIVNLSASSLATTLAIKLWGSVGAGIATGILTFLILVFGEISPKTFATLYADQISIAYSGIIGFLMKILTPVIFLVNQFSMGFLFLLHVDPKANNNQMTEEELRTIVDVSKENGVIESEEHEMINNLFDFGDAQAKEVMIPRPDMTFANVNNTYDELIDIFQEDKFTRLPVYEDTTDNVIGKKALKSGKTYYVRIDASKNVKVNKKSKTFKNTQYYTWKVKVK